MKKLFLFAAMIAVAGTTFAQTAATTQTQPVQKTITAPTYKEAQAAKMKQAPMKSSNANVVNKPQPQAVKASSTQAK